MARTLAYILCEAGPCATCGHDASDHAAADGICQPMGLRTVDPHVARPCYRGLPQFAFVDIDSGEARALAMRVLAMHAPAGL